MNPIDFSPISGQHSGADIAVDQSPSAAIGHLPNRPVAPPAGIDVAAIAKGAKQQRETAVAALVETAVAASRQAEVELHNAVNALRASVQKYVEPSQTRDGDSA